MVSVGTTRSDPEQHGLHNADIAWDSFDTGEYVAANYASLHDLDRQIIATLSPYYARLPPAGLASTLDLGTGPNLYPLMLVAAASRDMQCVEPSAANRQYLERVREHGADDTWQPFWRLCRQHNAALPEDLDAALRGLTVRAGTSSTVSPAAHDLVSMFFVAESVTGVRHEFRAICRAFAAAARPGGRLVAAFMAGMPAYRLGGRLLPAFPIDESALEEALADRVAELQISRLPADRSLPYEHDGVLLMTARARHPDGSR